MLWNLVKYSARIAIYGFFTQLNVPIGAPMRHEMDVDKKEEVRKAIKMLHEELRLSLSLMV